MKPPGTLSCHVIVAAPASISLTSASDINVDSFTTCTQFHFSDGALTMRHGILSNSLFLAQFFLILAKTKTSEKPDHDPSSLLAMCSSKILWLSADELTVVCDLLEPWFDPVHLCSFRTACKHLHISIALDYVKEHVRVHQS